MVHKADFWSATHELQMGEEDRRAFTKVNTGGSSKRQAEEQRLFMLGVSWAMYRMGLTIPYVALKNSYHICTSTGHGWRGPFADSTAARDTVPPEGSRIVRTNLSTGEQKDVFIYQKGKWRSVKNSIK